MKHTISRKAKQLTGVIALLIAWILVTRYGLFNSYVLPSPTKVLETFWKMLESGELFADITISFVRVLRGFSIAFLLAFVIAAFRIFLPRRAFVSMALQRA